MGQCITRTNATTQPRLLTSTSRSWPRTRLIAHLLLKTFSSKFTLSVVFCVLVVLCWSAKLLVGMFVDTILLSAKLLAGMYVSRLPCLQNCIKNLLQQTPQVTSNSVFLLVTLTLHQSLLHSFCGLVYKGCNIMTI